MGTRSVTIIHSEGLDSEPLVKVYRQMDGYFEGHGEELKEFLENIKLVNGLSLSGNENIANGMGCLAAQIITHFKDGPGSIYITNSLEEEYTYYVYRENNEICMFGEKFDGQKKVFLPLTTEKNTDKQLVSFLYPSSEVESTYRRRLINVKHEDDSYINGYDIDEDGSKSFLKKSYKSFLKRKIKGQITKFSN